MDCLTEHVGYFYVYGLVGGIVGVGKMAPDGEFSFVGVREDGDVARGACLGLGDISRFG